VSPSLSPSIPDDDGYAYLSIPKLTLSGYGLTSPPLQEYGTVATNIPVLTISSTGLTGQIGTMDSTDVYAVDSADIPIFTIASIGFTELVGTADLDILALMIEAELLAGMLLAGEIDLPPPTFLGVGYTGTYGTASLNIPVLEISAGTEAPLEIPVLEINALGYAGWIGTASLTIPPPTISATAEQQQIGIADLSIPPLQIAATGYFGQFVSASLNVPVPTLSASGYAGAVGTLDEEIPVSTIEAAGYPDQGTGTVDLDIPVFTIIATGTSATEAEPITVAHVFVVNTNNFAVSEYTNYPFNSFCYFNGIYLGAKSDGIFRLDQEDDAGVDIAMYIEKTKMDMGVIQTKRATDAYLNVNSDGEMDFKMIADDLWHTYRMRNGHSELRREKLNLGKGLKGQHLGFRFANVRGSDIVLDEIHLLTEILSRRVRSASYDD